jgi:hypothetical protein
MNHRIPAQQKALTLAAILMTLRSIIITTFLIVAFSGCENDESTPTNFAGQEKKPITGIEIYLMPAFNCRSTITVNSALDKVQFKIGETGISCRTGNADLFVMSLDSFRSNTLIDSFYSQTFLDSIEFKPGDFPAYDGLSILTVIKRGNISDTINSANVYPEMLATNIISQIDFISKKTTDTGLNKYIDDLRRYFQ